MLALLVFASGTAGLVLAADSVEKSPRPPREPNIVFILTDDQGYGDLACHGNPVIQTPHLDRLWRESVRFTDFQVSPTCSPTRAALATGRHEFHSGVTHTVFERERLSLRATTIAQVLKQAGYTTGIFGKWHLGDEAPYQPGRRGYDEAFIHGAGGIGQTYPGSCGDAPGNTYFDPAILHNGVFEKTKGYCTDVFFAQALRWIEAQKGRRPFYAQICTNAPHSPLDCPAEYEKKYAGKVPPNVARFYGMITNIDDNLGRLLAKLSEWGIERETLVIFMNDNGGTAGVPVYNAGMRGTKGTPYRGGTRAASFWRWPGVFQPGNVDRLAAHLDFFPTLAELAKAKIPAGVAIEGRSLVPLLTDHQAPWADRILFTHLGRWERGKAADSKYAVCSVRNTQYHLVNATAKGERWELFDVKTDPGERNNLVQQHPEVARQLKAALDSWWDCVQPDLVNENAVGPAANPFRELYWKQFGRSDAPATKHRFVAIDNGRNRLLYVNQHAPARNWSVAIPPGSRDLQRIEPGRVLVSHGNGAAEYDLATGRKLAWAVDRYSQVNSAQRLANGKTILGANIPAGVQVYELDRDGKETGARLLPGLKDLRLLRGLPSGNLLLTVSDPCRVIEIDPAGRVAWQAPLPGKGYKAIRLANGNTLVSTGGDVQVIELSPNGQIIFAAGGKPAHPSIGLDWFSGFDCLAGGNIVAANWLGHGKVGAGPHLVEFDRSNRLVWTWEDHQQAATVTNVLLVDP